MEKDDFMLNIDRTKLNETMVQIFS